MEDSPFEKQAAAQHPLPIHLYNKNDETFEGQVSHWAHLLKQQYKPPLPDCRVFYYKPFKDDWPAGFWKQSRQVMQGIRDDPNLWREYA